MRRIINEDLPAKKQKAANAAQLHAVHAVHAALAAVSDLPVDIKTIMHVRLMQVNIAPLTTK